MKLLDISQTARRLCVSESTVRRMLADPLNPLRAVRLHRGCIRVLEQSIDQLIDQRMVEKAYQE
jgi:DeoR/GlpR family transcriptional regulator of sugar metabolism